MEDYRLSKEAIDSYITRVKESKMSFLAFLKAMHCPPEVIPSFQKVSQKAGLDAIMEVFGKKQTHDEISAWFEDSIQALRRSKGFI